MANPQRIAGQRDVETLRIPHGACSIPHGALLWPTVCWESHDARVHRAPLTQIWHLAVWRECEGAQAHLRDSVLPWHILMRFDLAPFFLRYKASNSPHLETHNCLKAPSNRKSEAHVSAKAQTSTVSAGACCGGSRKCWEWAVRLARLPAHTSNGTVSHQSLGKS